MFTKRKNYALLTFTLLLSICLTGCLIKDFDASRYVQACLDASFHGEVDTYMEMTNSTKEQATSAYNQLIQSEVDVLEQGGYPLTDEQKEKFKALFIDMYNKCKYEVGEATKNDDNSFSVAVTTYQLGVFAGADDAIMDFAKDYASKNESATQEEVYSAVIDYMYDFMSEKIANPQYAQPVTKQVSVPLSSTNPKVYTISQTDLEGLVYDLLDIQK